MSGPRIIVPLDFATAAAALAMLNRLDPARCRVKVGKELFTCAGPALVEQIQKKGYEVFLDLKFHDIPNTVAGACRAAAGLGVWMLNVHASGGAAMLEAARAAVDKSSQRPLLTAVTVLTSLGEQDLEQIGVRGSLADQVMRLARLAHACQFDGVVCSAQEVQGLTAEFGSAFTLVTPGIRPAGSERNDQSRVMTPAAAINAGSHYLVIGRPVTAAADPLAALTAIDEEIRQVAGDQ